MMLDYEMMRLIWWVLLGVLLTGFAVTDGFDMGVGILLPFVAKTDTERRVLLNTIAPVWEGNQVWLVLGGGAVFAAFPLLYAVSFSGFYLAMFVVLVALILRPVGFKYRSKVHSPRWRRNWDMALFIGGFIPALIFGVAVGNVMVGVPFTLDEMMRPQYHGGLFGLLTPFPLMCGLVSVTMLVTHGACYLCLKTAGDVQERARLWGVLASVSCALLFALSGLVAWRFVEGYAITSVIDPLGPSMPLSKTVETQVGAWMSNYAAYPWMMLAPILGLVGSMVAWALLSIRRDGLAFVASAFGCFGIVSTVGVSIFPFLLPSSRMPEASLTIWDATSSHTTLVIMLVAVAVLLPIVLAYTSYAYRVMSGKVLPRDVEDNSQAY